ncbi:S-layer homology domain-containing protein [Demequina sp. NBRC 110054]|uniref:S-layer homology domain-containing protein n=1 Tax=Demequina sp. NBRC 110054 TaxID=1570343 RepID=UPI001177C012|nr:S-layer homology domain-containing protein [Demequina sp. NBRC 110054]
MAATVVTMSMAVVGLPSAATALETATVSVDLVAWTEAGDGAAATGGCVTLYSDADTVAATQCEGVDGAYELVDVTPGTYRIAFTGFDDLPDQWYDRADSFEDAADVVVDAAEVSVEYAMLPAASISGVVLDSTGEPAAGVTVEQYGSKYASTGTTATSDEAGRYVLVAEYKSRSLRFVPTSAGDGYQWQYASLASLDELITSFDVQLAPESSISGVLEIPESWDIDEACVHAVEDFGGHTSSFFASTYCGEVGSVFELDGLGAGTYNLCVSYDGTRCGSYLGSTSSVGATEITVGEDADESVDLLYGGTLRLTVTSGGEPISDGCVYVRDVSTSQGALSSCAGDEGVFVFEFGDNHSVRWQVAGVDGANDVSNWVSGAELVGGRTVEKTYDVGVYGQLSGTIDYSAVAGATGACVDAYKDGAVVGTACTEEGTYDYSLSLPKGSVTLRYRAVGAEAWQWYSEGDSSIADEAEVVYLDTDDVETIDTTLEERGAVVLDLTDAEGVAASGGCAVAYRADESEADRDCVGESGVYTVRIYGGDYLVRLEGFTGLPDQYVGGMVLGDAVSFAVTTGESQSYDYELSDGIGVVGVATARGETFTDGCVTAYRDDGTKAGETCVGPDGEFFLAGDGAGTYWLYFEGFADTVEGYYDPSGGWDSMTWTDETLYETFPLEVTATISGEVASDEEGMWADLYTWSGDWVETVDVVDGEYVFEDVREGQYKVMVGDADLADVDWVRTQSQSSRNRAPGRFIIADSTEAQLKGAKVSGGWDVWLAVDLAGKTSWSSEVVCLAAYEVTTYIHSVPTSVDCAAPGSTMYLTALDPGTDYTFQVAPRELFTRAEWSAYEGDSFWFGNADVKSESWYLTTPLANDGYSLDLAYYTDVDPTDSGFTAISWLGANEIAKGYADGSFRPGVKVSRQQMASFLYRLAGEPDFDVPSTSPYSDVKRSDSAYRAIAWLDSAGIAKGYSDGSFQPLTKVSRRQMASFLYKLAGKPDFDVPSKSPYSDVKKSDSAYKAIAWLDSTGIAKGYSDGTFRPGTKVSRRQMAGFMYRFVYSA